MQKNTKIFTAFFRRSAYLCREGACDKFTENKNKVI